MKGADSYSPGKTMSTDNKSPAALTMAFPAAPDPTPPQKITLGTPQTKGPVLHSCNVSSTALFKKSSTSRLKLKSSIFSGMFVMSLNFSPTFFAFSKMAFISNFNF